MTATDIEVIHAYRHIHRAALRASRFEKPARYVARDHIREAFRKDSRDAFDAPKIARTLEFLDTAIRVRGLEYRLTKNILRVWGERTRLAYLMARPPIYPFRKTAFVDFDRTLNKLNETMGMCIK